MGFLRASSGRLVIFRQCFLGDRNIPAVLWAGHAMDPLPPGWQWYVFGSNQDGQLGLGPPLRPQSAPVALPFAANLSNTTVALGLFHSALLAGAAHPPPPQKVVLKCLHPVAGFGGMVVLDFSLPVSPHGREVPGVDSPFPPAFPDGLWSQILWMVFLMKSVQPAVLAGLRGFFSRRDQPANSS